MTDLPKFYIYNIYIYIYIYIYHLHALMQCNRLYGGKREDVMIVKNLRFNIIIIV